VNDHFTPTGLPFAEVWENACSCTAQLLAADEQRTEFRSLDVDLDVAMMAAGAARSCARTTVSASMFSEILAPAVHAQFDLLHTRGALEELVFKYGRLLHGERGSCESRRSHAGTRDRMTGRSESFVRTLAATERSGDPHDRHQDRRMMTLSCNGDPAEYAGSAVVVGVQSE
jgi:hypothetical protein